MTTISIVTLTHNSEKYIERYASALLKAMLRHHELDYEMIVVDGYSTDRTVETLKIWLEGAEIYRDAGNLAECTNVALKRAHGRYVAFVDSDVEVPENWFDLIYRFEPSTGGIASFGKFTEGFMGRFTAASKVYAPGGLRETDAGLGMIATIYRRDLVEPPAAEAWCCQDKDIALSVNDQGYKTFVDYDYPALHFRETSLLNEMKRNYKYGQSGTLMYRRHKKYRRKYLPKRFASWLISLCFPFNLVFYKRKQKTSWKYAAAAWLITLSYNMGFFFAPKKPTMKERYHF